MRARVATAIAVCAWLGACAASGGSYGLGEGDANYDAMAQATKACQAQGGEIRLRTGYDSRELSSYQCRIGKAR